MTILLVDDELDTRTVTRLALEQFGGFTVVEAASGTEAMDAAAGVRPDLVILDVMMPEMDGPDVLMALRARADTADVPVMFLTAKVMPEELARLRALGAVAIHTKPFDPEEFAAAVRHVVDREYPGEPAALEPSATAAGPADNAEVDPEALRRLRGLTTETGGSLCAELIELFAGHTPAVLQRLRALVEEGPVSSREIERLAHALKGSALTLGAVGLAGAAREIEHAAHDGRVSAAEPLLHRLARDLEPTVARLRALLT